MAKFRYRMQSILNIKYQLETQAKMELGKAQMQERKMHEKLKEKALLQFLDEEKAAEAKVVDELTSYTYGQRGKGNGNGD